MHPSFFENYPPKASTCSENLLCLLTPGKEFMMDLSDSAYIFNCDTSQGQRIGCFNKGSAWSHDGSRTVLTLSVLLVVLLSRVISC